MMEQVDKLVISPAERYALRRIKMRAVIRGIANLQPFAQPIVRTYDEIISDFDRFVAEYEAKEKNCGK